jgi:K+-transporting ATPase ATPase C chain
MNALLRQSAAAIRVLLVFTVLLGLAYPLGVWLVSRIPGLQATAEGSVISHNGHPVGSALIGIDPVFTGPPVADPWFHNRPSATHPGPGVLGPGDASTSGGSNLGAFNPELVQAVTARKAAVAKREGVAPSAVPADAVTASGSGLDPAISPAYAELQAGRVARNNHLSPQRVHRLIAANTGTAGIGVPGVNVLELNLAVRQAAGR